MARRNLLANRLGAIALVAAISVLLFYTVPGLAESVLGFLGEDSTLTGRTDMWVDLLKEPINPLLGAGYQSFWLGPGAARMWAKYYFHPNQAHNAYLEAYLNGGYVGFILLVAMLVHTANRLRRGLIANDLLSCFALPLLVGVVLYSWSEAMLNRMSPLWFILLLAALCTSQSIGVSRSEARTPAAGTVHRPLGRRRSAWLRDVDRAK
jgi:O-antigen ligase